MAVTVLLQNDDDFWVVVAADLAHTPSMKAVRSGLKKDAVVPTAIPAVGKVEEGTEDAVDRFKRGLANQKLWGEDLGKRSEAVFIGASEGDVTRGKKEIAKLWKKREKVNVRHAVAGEITAGMTSDGMLAWVTGPVVRFADDEDVPTPMRLFAVFESDDKDEWRLIAVQESLVVDAPGAGTGFKKITAPPVKAEEPPPKPKEEKKKKPKKKKKKKKSDD
jgi:hypothetical protein